MLATTEAPSTELSKEYEWGTGRSVIQTDDGGYAIAGDAQRAWGGEGGFLLLKTNSNGDVQWQKNYGSGIAYSVIQTSDRGYVLAGSGTLFNLVKTDSQGNMQWNMTYPFQVYSVTQTSD